MSSFTEKERMATHLLKGLLQTQHNADYNEFKKTVSGYTDACFHQDLVDCVTYKIMDALDEDDVDICQYNDKCYFYLESEQEIDKMNQQGKEAKDIKDTITMMADDKKEETAAKEYAINKIKESLFNSQYNCKLANLNK